MLDLSLTLLWFKLGLTEVGLAVAALATAGFVSVGFDFVSAGFDIAGLTAIADLFDSTTFAFASLAPFLAEPLDFGEGLATAGFALAVLSLFLSFGGGALLPGLLLELTELELLEAAAFVVLATILFEAFAATARAGSRPLV